MAEHELDLSQYTGEVAPSDQDWREIMTEACVDLKAYQLGRTVDGDHDRAGIVMAATRDVAEILNVDPDLARHAVAVGIAAGRIATLKGVR